MIRKLLTVLSLTALSVTVPLPSFALDKQEFDRIRTLKMAALVEEAEALMEEKYPDEGWDAFRFPKFVFTSKEVETGYRIAVKEQGLLQPIPCYCFCDEMGHRNLLHCFLKKGKVGGKFDDHAVTCNICYGQAMLAFLWREKAGASEQDILNGMKEKFERLIKERGHPH